MWKQNKPENLKTAIIKLCSEKVKKLIIIIKDNNTFEFWTYYSFRMGTCSRMDRVILEKGHWMDGCTGGTKMLEPMSEDFSFWVIGWQKLLVGTKLET